MTKTFCDRCKRKAKLNCGLFFYKITKFLNMKNYTCKDLCQRCFTALESFLNNK